MPSAAKVLTNPLLHILLLVAAALANIYLHYLWSSAYLDAVYWLVSPSTRPTVVAHKQALVSGTIIAAVTVILIGIVACLFIVYMRRRGGSGCPLLRKLHMN